MQAVGANLKSTTQQVITSRSGHNHSLVCQSGLRDRAAASCPLPTLGLSMTSRPTTLPKMDVPLFSRQDDAIGCIDDLPLKAMGGRYLAKIVVDVIVEVPLDSVNYQQLEEYMLQGQYTHLPPPFCPRTVPGVPYKMSVAIMKTSPTQCTVLRYFVFDTKTNLRTVEDMAYGVLKLIGFTPNFRSGPLAVTLMLQQMSHCLGHYTQLTPQVLKKHKHKQDGDELQNGFAYIKSDGPRSSIGNRQVEWAEIEIRRAGSPIHGWSAGLVKDLRGLASGNVYAKTINNFSLTVHDLAGWFLDQVLVEVLEDLRHKTIVFLGLAEKGKTPAAQAIAMAVSVTFFVTRRRTAPSRVSGSVRPWISLGRVRREVSTGHFR